MGFHYLLRKIKNKTMKDMCLEQLCKRVDYTWTNEKEKKNDYFRKCKGKRDNQMGG